MENVEEFANTLTELMVEFIELTQKAIELDRSGNPKRFLDNLTVTLRNTFLEVYNAGKEEVLKDQDRGMGQGVISST